MIHFTVYGHPEPQGSTRAFIPKGWTRPVVTSANKKNKPWRQEVAGAAQQVLKPLSRKQGGVWLHLVFFLQRPASLPKKFTVVEKKPDLDKLARSVLDALTGIAYEDDSQVCAVFARKFYGTPERVEISVEEILHGEPTR